MPHFFGTNLSLFARELARAQLPIYPFKIEFVRIDRDDKAMQIGTHVVDRLKSKLLRVRDIPIIQDIDTFDFASLLPGVSFHQPTVYCVSNLAKWLTREQVNNLIERIKATFVLRQSPLQAYLRINAPSSEPTLIDWLLHEIPILGRFFGGGNTEPSRNQVIRFIHPKNRKEERAHYEFWTDAKCDSTRRVTPFSKIPFEELKSLHAKAKFHQCLTFDGSGLIWRGIEGTNLRPQFFLETSLRFAYETWLAGEFVDPGFQYSFPKKKKGATRTLTLLSPIDAIVECKVLDTIGPPIERHLDEVSGGGPVAFGNRLQLNKTRDGLSTGRSIFRYWPTLFRDRMFSLLQNASREPNGVTVSLDIQNYYPSIPHDELMDIVVRRVPTITKSDRLWLSKYIECGATAKGMGVSQGPPLTHVLANLYLAEKLDSKLRHGQFQTSKYSRYVDDILYVAQDDTEAKRFVEWVSKTILPLKLNQDKRLFTKNSIVADVLAERAEIEKIRHDIEILVKLVYQSGKIWRKLGIIGSSQDFSSFHKALIGIGINLPVSWLRMKVEGRNDWLWLLFQRSRRIGFKSMFLGIDLKRKNLFSDLKPEDIADQLRKANPRVAAKVTEIRTEIVSLISRNLAKLSQLSSEWSYERASLEARLRFLIFRLRYLATPDAESLISPLFSEIEKAGDSLASPLRLLKWNLKSDLPQLEEKMDREESHDLVKYLRNSELGISFSGSVPILREDTKLAIIEQMKSKHVPTFLNSEKGVEIKGDRISVILPFFSSLGHTVEAHRDRISTWIQIPYDDALDVDDGFPDLPDFYEQSDYGIFSGM